MTPIDEAPEQRWRRTVDRRNRPAKLKVDRLLRDFGYDELDALVGEAIEARLAGVALAVAPSLLDAAVSEVVTIYANDAAVQDEAAPAAGDADPGTTVEPPPEASDVAQMVTYLKQQVLDARAESERLRSELDRRIAARTDADSEAQAIIAEQAAALQDQARQIAELGAALDHTRQALAETRDEIRRAVGELQAMPEPLPADEDIAADEEPLDERSGDEESLSGEESDGREHAEASWAVSGGGPEPDPEPPADLPPAFDAPEPVPGESVLAAMPPLDPTDPPVEAPAREGDEPPLGEEPAFELGELPIGEARDTGAAAGEPTLDDDLVEWQLGAAAGEPTLDDDLAEWPLGAAAPLDEPQASPADGELAGFELRPAEPPPAAFDPFPSANADVDDHIDEDLLTGLDEFLYDADELYEPVAGGGAHEPQEGAPETLDELRWQDAAAPLDEMPTDLPPPPPAPPSPWADEPEPEIAVERATIGKVLRGRGARGGRGRGRWQGSCSICGREPGENRRKDLEAAGWDLDDTAAACPQCRGIG